MTALTASLIVATLLMQTVGYCALVASNGKNRKTIERLSTAITQMKAGAPCASCVGSTNGVVGDSK